MESKNNNRTNISTIEIRVRIEHAHIVSEESRKKT